MTDFYGTIAKEDTNAVLEIANQIAANSTFKDTNAIVKYWWDIFYNLMLNAEDRRFITKRQIAMRSLERTIQYYGAKISVDRWVNLLYQEWQNPTLYDDVKEFLATAPVPVCFVSNADKDDIISAIISNRLMIHSTITSEDAKCYKPNPLIFQHAITSMDLKKHEVVFIGDSITCDIIGSHNAGIDSIWLNRDNKPVSKFMDKNRVATDLIHALDLIKNSSEESAPIIHTD